MPLEVCQPCRSVHVSAPDGGRGRKERHIILSPFYPCGDMGVEEPNSSGVGFRG